MLKPCDPERGPRFEDKSVSSAPGVQILDAKENLLPEGEPQFWSQFLLLKIGYDKRVLA